MGEQGELITLPVDRGGLTDVPAWGTHRRTKNWAATITGVSPTAPGGFERVFWKKSPDNSPFYYAVPEGLKVGDAVVFASDYTNTTGNKELDRHYLVVTRIGEKELELLDYDDPIKAWDGGQELIRANAANAARPDGANVTSSTAGDHRAPDRTCAHDSGAATGDDPPCDATATHVVVSTHGSDGPFQVPVCATHCPNVEQRAVGWIATVEIASAPVDVTTPEGWAIHGLFLRIKNEIEEPDGSWPGSDVVDALTAWFTSLGYDVADGPTGAEAIK